MYLYTACVHQEPHAGKRRELVNSMCQLEERMQAAVTALHITAAKLLLALGTHIVIPRPQGGRQRAGQNRLRLGEFIQRLTDVSSTALGPLGMLSQCMFILCNLPFGCVWRCTCIVLLECQSPSVLFCTDST